MPGIALAQYQAWDANVSRDEADLLDDTTSWDETAGAENLINYLFDTASALKYFEGAGIFESAPVSLARCGRMQSSKITWAANTPPGTSVSCKVSLSPNGGVTWGPWQSVTNGGAIPGLAAGLDLSNHRLKVRFEVATTDYNVGPNITQFEITINSRKIFRLMPDGALKAAKALVQNASETI